MFTISSSIIIIFIIIISSSSIIICISSSSSSSSSSGGSSIIFINVDPASQRPRALGKRQRGYSLKHLFRFTDPHRFAIPPFAIPPFVVSGSTRNRNDEREHQDVPAKRRRAKVCRTKV